MNQHTCNTCRNFVSEPVDGDAGQGSCRRYPPTLCLAVLTQIDLAGKPKQQIMPVSRFPVTSEELWCGEHVISIAMMS